MAKNKYYQNKNGYLTIEELVQMKHNNTFDNSKIKITDYPILNRITYIAFPIWQLEELAKAFQDLI